MAEQEAKDNAAKSRIINHMNNDHHESLIRYLEHYCKVPSWQAYDGRMSGIGLRSMTFVCRGKTYHIPLEPPMSSYRDARERAVQMDKESLEGLGRSDITITEFLPPQGFSIVIFALVAATFIGYSQRWWFAEGQIVQQVLGSGFARFSYAIQPYLMSLMLAIHGAELAYFVPNRLIKHSINPRTAIFWKWAGTTFLEGVSAFQRFDKLVAAKREEKEKQKH